MENKCPICNSHLFVKKATQSSVVFSCRNPKCSNCNKDVVTKTMVTKAK